MSTRFQKKIENFRCRQCSATVRGNGFTNHCPDCLWSLHVDCYPGDRNADCGGLMEPTGVAQRNGKMSIVFRCTKCGIERVNRTSPADNTDAIIAVSQLQIGSAVWPRQYE